MAECCIKVDDTIYQFPGHSSMVEDPSKDLVLYAGQFHTSAGRKSNAFVRTEEGHRIKYAFKGSVVVSVIDNTSGHYKFPSDTNLQVVAQQLKVPKWNYDGQSTRKETPQYFLPNSKKISPDGNKMSEDSGPYWGVKQKKKKIKYHNANKQETQREVKLFD